jgi:hypothetical protein
MGGIEIKYVSVFMDANSPFYTTDDSDFSGVPRSIGCSFENFS